MSIAAPINPNTQPALQEGVDYKIETFTKEGLWMSLDRFYAGCESRLDKIESNPLNGVSYDWAPRLPFAFGQGMVALGGIVGESTIVTLCLVTLQKEAAKGHLYGAGHCVRHLAHAALNLTRVFIGLILPTDSLGKILSYPGALEEKKIVYLKPKEAN